METASAAGSAALGLAGDGVRRGVALASGAADARGGGWRGAGGMALDRGRGSAERVAAGVWAGFGAAGAGWAAVRRMRWPGLIKYGAAMPFAAATAR